MWSEFLESTLILKALLNPLAKNPPKGPMTEAKIDMKKAWSRNGYNVTVSFIFSWIKKLRYIVNLWIWKLIRSLYGNFFFSLKHILTCALKNYEVIEMMCWNFSRALCIRNICLNLNTMEALRAKWLRH